MKSKNILVLGSKPNSNLPNVIVDKIYTANGAAEKGEIFRRFNSNNELTCICGASEFARNENVSKRIITAKPDRLIIRSGAIELPESLNDQTKLYCYSNFEQWKFQSAYFNYSFLALFLSEFFHQNTISKKILYVLKGLKNKKLQGTSTGFFAILLALHENPNSNIIISGIGMKGGNRFYNLNETEVHSYDSRAKVDRFLSKYLKSIYRKRLFSLDDDLVKNGNIQKWQGKIIENN